MSGSGKRKSDWPLALNTKKGRRAMTSDVQWGTQSTVVGVSTTFMSDGSGRSQVTTTAQTAPSGYSGIAPGSEEYHRVTGGTALEEPVAGPDEPVAGQESNDAHEDFEDDGLPGPEVTDPVEEQTDQEPRSKSRKPIWAWIAERPMFLRELINLDGRHRALDLAHLNMCRNTECKDTRTKRRYYRCVSGCMRCDWCCRSCLLKKHADLPLHRVESWVEGHWQSISLRNLGLKVNLGHPDGSPCAQPQATVANFVVVHTNGVHEVKAVFCGCTQTFVAPTAQLLRDRWWPATADFPKTAATFEALDCLDALGTAGKTNAFEFWNAMCALTDFTGTHTLPDRSKELARMVHEWRHILMCKRGGRGHDRFGGIEETLLGDLAVLCPACPHEGLNTDILEKVSAISPELAAAIRHFERVFAAMDCNFRAKNKDNLSTFESSPILGDGMAFMVPYDEYEDFTATSGHQDEMSSCSRFGAMVLANLKAGKGMRTTGIGAVFCSRHGLFWPNTVGTLVKGERWLPQITAAGIHVLTPFLHIRYCTMDYILAAFVRRLRASELHLSYDIICQYSKNLDRRMADVEGDTPFMLVGAQKLLDEISTTFAIPKFHSPGHKALCQQWFNLALQLYAGQTDGEASERAWAGLNRAAASMREMGPGHMRDTIDFYCNMWNWKKFINMGPFLIRKMELALREAEDHTFIHTGLRKALAAESAETVDEWTDEVVVFERRDDGELKEGGPVKNPYKPLAKPKSLHQARLESAELMAAALEKLGASDARSRKESATSTTGADRAPASPELTNFVLRGFKIEMLRLRAIARQKVNTVLQRAEKREQANEVARLLVQFRKDQQWIQPLVSAGVSELEGDRAEANTREEDGDSEDEDEDEIDAGPSGDGDEDDVEAGAPDDLPLGNKVARGLYLPSELPRELALQQPRELLYEELRLRWAGMGDDIVIIRQYCRIKGTVAEFKRKTVRGQRHTSRARTKQNAIEANLYTVKESYRVHRARFARLVSLMSEREREEQVPANWEDRFRELEDGDCIALGQRLLMRIEDEQIKRVHRIVTQKHGGSSGESSHKVPWIWYTVVEGGIIELNDEMRVEYLKCRARAMRWTEEVYALCFEMIRTPRFVMRKAEWWERKAGMQLSGLSKLEKDGARAYAKKQATMYRRQAEKLEKNFAESLTLAAAFVKTHGLDGLLKEA
ncbi:unnamed protein product [Peniophora sp. CBMAI 1063]|nr:unnamed protein product [Peniophora sp. CBMAI 1063]